MDPNEEVKTAPEGVETGDIPSTPDPVVESVNAEPDRVQADVATVVDPTTGNDALPPPDNSGAADGLVTPTMMGVETAPHPADPQFAEEAPQAPSGDPGLQAPGTVGQDAPPAQVPIADVPGGVAGAATEPPPLSSATEAPVLAAHTGPEVDAMMFHGISLAIMLAKICHEANKAYCQMIGDFSHQPWESAGAEMQMSVIDGTRFHLANPDAPVSASHENWLKFKAAAGWVYGEVKDVVKKTHPCFVPFNQLPETDKVKSYLFKSIVDAFRP